MRNVRTQFWSVGIAISFVLILFSCKPELDQEALPVNLFRRSVLDQKARMLTLKYGDHYWLSYDLQHMVPYKLWIGGVLWNGAAFNNIKTVQPSSFGISCLEIKDPSSFWQVKEKDGPLDFQVQFKSYEVTPEEQLLFNYEVIVGDQRVAVEERPLLFIREDSLCFERRFRIKNAVRNAEIRIQGVAITNRSEIRKSFPLVEPPVKPQEISSENGAQYWLDRSGCTTCHQPLERNVGPSYQEIANRYDASDETLNRLIDRVKNGSAGEWGPAQMIPHPHLDNRDLRNMVRYILSLKSEKPSRVAAASSSPREEPKPKTPGFGAPLAGVHPSFDLIRIRPDHFKPRVGGMTWTDQGDLLISTWDSIGAVYQIRGLEKDDPGQADIKMIASGLSEPLGITTVGEDIFVLQKHELTQLIDRDGDGITDVYRCINNQFQVTPDFHEFSYGLIHHEGKFYGGLGLAMRLMSSERQLEDRGTVFSIDADHRFEVIARGLRQPNGIGLGPEDEIFVTDNQGQWVPACKLIQVKKDEFYGCQFGTGERFKNKQETVPAVYLPQDEIGNSPTQPVMLRQGPYTGQMIFGDVTHGGIKRVFLEKIGEDYQGCVFRFSQGLEAGVNRLAIGPDGAIYVGGVGMNGGWAHREHQFGLEKLKYKGQHVFEIFSIKIQKDGFILDFTSPLSREIAFDQSNIKLSQWRYEATERYGGPKLDLEDLPVENMIWSDDRKSLQLRVPGIKQNHVVYFLLDENLKDEEGRKLWSGEAWYTTKNLKG